MLAAALCYAEDGWPVLPLHNPVNGTCSCGRSDCSSPAKHPRTPHGLKDASRDPQTLRGWWRRWPAANVGLVTGIVADVADLDGPGGVAGFRAECKEHDLDPLALPRVGTGRGFHVYFAPTGAGNRAGIIPGVDWRGRAGYVVAPPSTHIGGRIYTWRLELHGPPPAPPAWLVRLLEKPSQRTPGVAASVVGPPSQYGRSAFEAELNRVHQAAEGERNDTLNRGAFSLFQLVAGGELDGGDVDAALQQAGKAVGLSAGEVDRTIASGRRDGCDQPRSRPVASRNRSELNVSVPVAVSAPAAWPSPLDAAAYHGLAGDVVGAIEPHTEADPVAVLVGFLVAFGNIIGAGPHAVVGSTHHPARLFAVLVGETARARKGDSWSAVCRLVTAAAPDWADGRVQSGLSSGEGVIAAVRDPLEQTDRKTGELSVADAGISDKRLLVVEPELARTLRVMRRDASTLSTILREAWDTGALRVMTKVQVRASGAHVSALGHITVEELRRELDETSLANGFANRFLWLAVRRSKLLPDPEPFAGPKVVALADRIRSAIEFAQGIDEVERDEEARAVWRAVYGDLTADRPGMLGAVVNRCEAQAVRLSLIYAVLDQSPTVRRVHLHAALAVIDYVESSARYIFADRLGDPVADAILRAVDDREELTRTEISDLFNRHASAERIGAGLSSLAAAGLLVRDSRATGGRPVELWRRPT
jgi:hypothetical protein